MRLTRTNIFAARPAALSPPRFESIRMRFASGLLQRAEQILQRLMAEAFSVYI
jgi:hypothetical protein